MLSSRGAPATRDLQFSLDSRPLQISRYAQDNIKDEWLLASDAISGGLQPELFASRSCDWQVGGGYDQPQKTHRSAIYERQDFDFPLPSKKSTKEDKR